LTEAQKVEKYNCLRAFEMCLLKDFDESSTNVMTKYLDERKKTDLQNAILKMCQQKVE
jgi:hypothetical protein